MTEWRPDPKFEDNIRESFGVPEPRAKFLSDLQSNLERRASEKKMDRRAALPLRPAWAIPTAILAALLLVTLAIGPRKVFAAFKQLLGYIPGIGIIEQGNGLRILAEPVTLTREGITITVSQAVLTGAGTQLEYSITGVSLSAYPREESNPGCMDAGYLRLPDGTQLASGAGRGVSNQFNFDQPGHLCAALHLEYPAGRCPARLGTPVELHPCAGGFRDPSGDRGIAASTADR
jgi:hypothetical protein